MAIIRRSGKKYSFFTFLFIKAEVREKHKSQLASSFKEAKKQCLSFYS